MTGRASPGAAAATLRAGEWWHYKLVPILIGFYATSLYCGEPVTASAGTALLFLIALLPGAAFVSVVNDMTDIRADAAAGKRNQMAGRSPLFRGAALLATMAAGAPFFWYWRGEPMLVALYAAAWISFALYSVPPVRLKERGAAGIFADASGAHLFPTLLGAGCVFVAAGKPVDPLWLGTLGLWALAYGCRGILWHQMNDRERDRRSGVRTFAARRPPEAAARGAFGAFLVEVAALLALMLLMGSVLPLLAALYDLLLASRRVRLWGVTMVVAGSKPDSRIWLDEYYGVLFPLSLLAASAAAAPADLVALAVHLLLFPRRPLETLRDSHHLVLMPALRRLLRLRPADQGS